MAVTENAYTGNGSTTNYSFTFPYLKSTDIQVQVDAVVTTAWSLANATTIQFNSAPANGAAIKILRDTNVDNLTATFYAGSAIKSEDLNDNFTQNLYVTQEVGNRSFENTGTSTMIGNLNMGEDTSVVFEGATDNAHETTLTVTDPTADRTITLPDVTGTVVTTGDTATVTAAMLAANSVDSSELVDGSIDTSHFSAGSVNTAALGADAVTGAKIADDSVDSEHLAADSIDAEHYAAGSVDTTALGADAVTGAKVADNAIDSEHYVDGSIDTAHIANLQVTTAKIAADAIDGTKIADDSVDSEHLVADSIDTEHYAANSVDTTALAADAVTGAQIADDAIDSEHLVDGSIDTAHLSADCIDGTKIADNAIGAEHIAANAVTSSEIADAELTTLASMPSATASILADSTALTSTTAELNLLDGKSVVTSVSGSSTDVQLPTAKAVNDQIVALLQDIGGFVPIANEVSFPNANPDPNNDAGTIVSIADAGGVVVNGSGVSTTGRTLGGATVTINGIDSTLHSTTIAAGKGMLVQTTSTLNTYDYHRLIVDEAGVAAAQTLVTDFNQRYQVTSDSTAPTNQPDGTALAEGDLWFDGGTNKMKVYNGSAYDQVTSIGDYKLLTIVPDGQTSGTPTFDDNIVSYDLRDDTGAANITSPGQLLVSLNGVLQKPNATSWSSSNEGFHLEGTNGIKFCTAPPSNSSLFITLIGSATTINTPGNNSVTSDTIQAAAVTTAKIADLNVTTAKIAADAITGAKIADDAIDSEHYTDGSIDTAHIANDQITQTLLADDAVVQQKIADNAVNADRIDAGAVGATELAGTLNLSSKTVTLPAASVTAHVTQYNDNTVMSNIAMLGFKVAAANDLAKYNLVDQVIDEFEDSSGIDASASTNEVVTGGYVYGQAVVSPSRSGNWDSTGTDGDYTWWKWTGVTTSGSYTTDTAQTYEYLVVGGGGGGGSGWSNDACGSGGGAGAYRTATGFSIAAGTLSGISVGAGGAGGANTGGGANGGDSVMSTITSNGGGGGNSHNCGGGTTPGNGSSSGKGSAGETCSAPTTAGAYGNDGGSATGGGISTDNTSTGGGGGAGGNGGNGASASVGGSGGVGLQNDIDGTNSWYAAGGGGGSTHGSGTGQQNSIGGNGASTGNQAGGNAVANTGSGGGGASNIGGSGANGGNGGSGIVILRALTNETSTGGNLTLQSTATTAKDGAPTKADLIILMEDAVGSATEDVDVKGFVSRDGTNFSGAVDFVDEGTWGTNKRILAAHDVDISGIATGTSMKYKIQTLNQSNGSKETKIHAVSLGWR